MSSIKARRISSQERAVSFGRASGKRPDPSWQSLIKLGIYTGQWLGDLAGLTWNDVLLNEGVIRIRSHKTNLKIEIPIVGPLQERLLALHSRNGSARFLHPQAGTKMRGQRGRTNSLSNDFIAILGRRGSAREKNAPRQGHSPFGSARTKRSVLSQPSAQCSLNAQACRCTRCGRDGACRSRVCRDEYALYPYRH